MMQSVQVLKSLLKLRNINDLFIMFFSTWIFIGCCICDRIVSINRIEHVMDYQIRTMNQPDSFILPDFDCIGQETDVFFGFLICHCHSASRASVTVRS